MSTAEIVSRYKENVKTIDIHSKIKENSSTSLSGLSGNLNVIVPLSVSQKDSFCHCFIISDKEKALIYYSNLCNFLTEEKVYFFPYSFIAPYDDELINNANVVMRTEVIQSLLENNKEKIYIVTYPEGLFEKFPEERIQKEKRTVVKTKDKVNLVDFVDNLDKKGFNKVDFVVEPGQYAVRGNIIDVFSYSYKKPIRIELDGNEIDKLRLFDTNSQLTENNINSAKIVSNDGNDNTHAHYVSLFNFFNKNWVLWTDEVGLSANIIKEKKIQIEKAEDENFYKVHETKPFYNDLCNYLSSGPIVVMTLQRENAVVENRKLMGATNPVDADEGTLRKKYGISIDKNSVHGSDAPETAAEEIAYFFAGNEILR